MELVQWYHFDSNIHFSFYIVSFVDFAVLSFA